MDFASITELVGEGIREAYDANTMYVALYDAATNVISFPYEVEKGERLSTEPFELGPGLTSTVIRERKPLRIGTDEEAKAAGAITIGDVTTESWLGVPILAGDEVLGVIALESVEPHAFPEEMERLLAALASSVGVALSNARLFDETKRLLADTNQRAAELAVINEIGEALGKQLEFEAIIQLVGERVREQYTREAPVHRHPRAARRPHLLPVRDRRRQALPPRPPAVREGADLAGHPDGTPAARGRQRGVERGRSRRPSGPTTRNPGWAFRSPPRIA